MDQWRVSARSGLPKASRRHRCRRQFPTRADAAWEHLPTVLSDFRFDEPIELLAHGQAVHLERIELYVVQLDVVEPVNVFTPGASAVAGRPARPRIPHRQPPHRAAIRRTLPRLGWQNLSGEPAKTHTHCP